MDSLLVAKVRHVLGVEVGWGGGKGCGEGGGEGGRGKGCGEGGDRIQWENSATAEPPGMHTFGYQVVPSQRK